MILSNTSPQVFVGRDEILGILDKRIQALKSGYRQNIALTGQKLCGKTSILQHFLSNLNDNSVIPVYIEVLTEPLETFSKKFMGTMLFNFLKALPEETKEDLSFLLSKAEQYLPKTATSIKEVLRLLERQDYQEAYSALFNLTSLLKEESKKSCIIILDEFHNLSSFNLKSPFAIFGKKIMVQKDTMYIVTSSQVSSIRRILKERLDLLFGNFEIIEVKDFDFLVSCKFLERRLGAIKVVEELRDFIILFTDGRPFYLDVISSELINITAQLQFKWLGASYIAQAFENLLFDSKGTINQYFQNLISTFGQTPFANEYLDILSTIAEGNRKLTQIRQGFKGKRADFSGRLDKLIEENLISKNGAMHYLTDNVFQFWLRYVYNTRRTSLVNIFQDRSALFKKDVEELISSFLAEHKRDIHERVKDLFVLFDNEVLKIEEKNVKFPSFKKIEMEGPFLRAIYGPPGKSWLLKIADRPITEADMIKLIEEFEVLQPAPQRKILISPYEIDTNSMVLAKANKIWLWGRDSLNLILALYGKLKF